MFSRSLRFLGTRNNRTTHSAGASVESVRDTLSHNLGFDKPERWIDYAQRKEFSPVRAYPIHQCPDCGTPSEKILGQYVHYSTLHRLRECLHCGLIWSDARLDE